MELLIGFAVATVLVLGWFAGNLFCCTMLTLGSLLMVGLGILMATSGEPGNIAVGPWFIYIGSAITVIAWTPRWYRKRFIGVPAGSAERLDRPLELL